MKLLVDSDFLIALYKSDDSNHKKAVKIFKSLGKNYQFIALNLVFQESTTVISKKMGMDYAREFLAGIARLIVEKISLNQDLEIKTWKYFLQQTKKGTSFIDCANLIASQVYKLDGILSFDEFYGKLNIKRSD